MQQVAVPRGAGRVAGFGRRKVGLARRLSPEQQLDLVPLAQVFREE